MVPRDRLGEPNCKIAPGSRALFDPEDVNLIFSKELDFADAH